jgi:hypothetical protein
MDLSQDRLLLDLNKVSKSVTFNKIFDILSQVYAKQVHGLILNKSFDTFIETYILAPAVLHLRKEPGIHWIWGWVGLSAGLDAVVQKNLLSLLGMEPQLSDRYIDWAMHI